MKRVKIVLLVVLLAAIAAMTAPYWWPKKKSVPVAQPTIMSDEVCLARNLAYETLLDSHKKPGARRELEAIVHVVFQRKALGRKAGYRNTVCEVVYQRNQFSWTRKRALRQKVPDDKVRWAYLLQVARDGLAGRFEYPWPESHACIVGYKRADNKGVNRNPLLWFRARMRSVTVIGSHEFYCSKKKKK